MKLRGLFVFMLAASLAVQPLSADRAWGEMTIVYRDPITGETSGYVFDEASLGQIDIFTSNENLNIGVQYDNKASVIEGGNNGRLEVTLGISDTPTFDSVTADSVTIGDAAAGATIKKTANGLSMGNSVLSDLANGTADTDAATVGQMNAADAMLRADIDTNTANIAPTESVNRIL